MDETDAERLKVLRKENAELKKMYAEAMLGMKVLKEAHGNELLARCTAGIWRGRPWPKGNVASGRRAGSSA